MSSPGGASPKAFEARRVERRFGSTRALCGVDLVVEAGTTLALFGPNGAGKTTLLRVLAQLLRPSRGEVRVLGLDPARDLDRVLAAIGFLSHEVALYLDLTPRENLQFTARLFGLDGAGGRIDRALAAVGLTGKDLPVRALSRGLQQRAALARALLHEPPLLLLDEPWTGLDPGAQAVLRERLHQHRERGGTTVFTTHDLGQGLAAADQVALLGRGRLLFAAAARSLALAELEAAYARAAADPGSPPAPPARRGEA